MIFRPFLGVLSGVHSAATARKLSAIRGVLPSTVQC